MGGVLEGQLRGMALSLGQWARSRTWNLPAGSEAGSSKHFLGCAVVSPQEDCLMPRPRAGLDQGRTAPGLQGQTYPDRPSLTAF